MGEWENESLELAIAGADEYLKKYEYNAQAYLTVGIDLLKKCERQFLTAVYVKAIDCLIEAYRLEASEDVFDLLYKVVYQPNEDFFRETYEHNAMLLKLKGWDVCAFQELKFLLFPIDEQLYRIYDKENCRFLAKNEVCMRFEYSRMMMTEEKIDFEKLMVQIKTKEHEMSVQALYREIELSLSHGKSEDVLYDKIKIYTERMPNAEECDYLLGWYYFNKGKYQDAEFYAEKAAMKCRLNLRINLFLASCKEVNGDYITAVYLYLLMLKIYPPTDSKIDLSAEIMSCINKAKAVSADYYALLLDMVSKAESNARMAPWQYTVQKIDETGMDKITEVLYGRHLWKDDKDRSHFIALYNEYGLYNTESRIMEALAEKNLGYLCVTFDLVKASVMKKVHLLPQEVPYIIPIAAFHENQEISFMAEKSNGSVKMGKFEFNYFKIEEKTKIISSEDFAIGRPIVLSHDKKRKKMVLNLFVDALSFDEMEKTSFRYTPNMIKFFQKGIIFTNNYTPAEWTFPSSAAIQTGRYQGKTQLFHQQANIRLSNKIKTVAEYFNEKGYYCTNILESNEMVYSQLHRGYERIVLDSLPRANIGVDRAIQHLEAYDTDHFLSLHFMDIHPFFEDHHLSVGAQRNLSLAERLTPKYGSNVKSVFIEPSAIAVEEYHNSLKNLDRCLGYLFSYIKEHYHEDEYIVSLYSDHGVSVFSENHYFFDEGQGKTALMFRGAGVPSRGFVKDEVTNTIDWYRLLLHLGDCPVLKGDAEEIDAVLPKCFGGEGREYTISNSLTPYQTYKLCIRTMDHEFRLETKNKTTYDGKVDLSEFTYDLYKRDGLHTKIDDYTLLEYFLTIAQEHTQRIRVR